MDKLIEKIVHYCLDTKLVLFLIVIAFLLKLFKCFSKFILLVGKSFIFYFIMM